MRNVLFYTYDGMADFEISLAAHMLTGNSMIRAKTVCCKDGFVKSRSGFVYKPDMQIREISIEETDGLIIPGGQGSELNPEIIELIKAVHLNDKFLGAICAGTVFLAKAGVLENVKYTTPVVEWTEKYKLVYKQEIDPFPRDNLVVERVVEDKNVLTAQGYAFVDFTVELCDVFKIFEYQEEKEHFAKTLCGI